MTHAMVETYRAPDGTKYPVREARHNMVFTVYKSDRGKAIPGDPYSCVAALGILRDPTVLHVYIGSGYDAYIVFAGQDEDEMPYAEHFIIPRATRKIINEFDKSKKSVKTAKIELMRPSRALTLKVRRERERERAERIRNGTHTPKKATKARPKHRIERLGVPHRPRPPLTRSGKTETITIQD